MKDSVQFEKLIQELLDKHEKIDCETLRLKVAYVNCIEDTLETPNEVWLHPEIETILYFKRYLGNITIIVKVRDSILQDFDVIEGNLEWVNSLRRGVPISHQEME